MDLNDNVRITLTRDGAEFLIKQDAQKLKEFKDTHHSAIHEVGEMIYPGNWHEDQVIRCQLHSVFRLFKDFSWKLGGKILFKDLELDNDERVHIRASLESVQASQRADS